MEEVDCLICGEKDTQIVVCQRDLLHFVSEEEYTINKCQVCGFQYLSPRPSLHEIGQFYPDEYLGSAVKPRKFSRVREWLLEDYYGYPRKVRRDKLSWLRTMLIWPEKIRREWAGGFILPWIGSGRLLDVGCGNGIGSAILQQQGWDVYGAIIESSV